MAKKRPEGAEADLVRLYFDEIGKYPLLTKEDEGRLARAIEGGRQALEEVSAPGVSMARRRQLQREIRAGEQATREFIATQK